MLLQEIAKTCVLQAEGLKSKQRDTFCVSFFFGAWSALHADDHPAAAQIGTIAMYGVRFRGYPYVLELSQKGGENGETNNGG